MNDGLHHIKPMSRPNETIELFAGNMIMTWDQSQLILKGTITFKWFPYLGPTFEGQITSISGAVSDLLSFPELNVLVNGVTVGSAKLTGLSSDTATTLEGYFPSLVFGDVSVDVSTAFFIIPNLRKFYGVIQPFEDDTYLIKINTTTGFMKQEERLYNTGGFLETYQGSIVKKNGGTCSYSEIMKVTSQFGAFLAMINGRRCSPIIITGTNSDGSIWRNCTPYQIDIYKGVDSCFPSINPEISQTWKRFSILSKNESDFHFLKSVIHWYVEANLNSGLAEGAIILAQTALELIYNWLIVEQHKTIKGDNAIRLDASNKIRLLLSQLPLQYDVPKCLNGLSRFAAKEDGPEIFVKIRNAIVHSQEAKRNLLTTIGDNVKDEVRHLALWYIELLLLKILRASGNYRNRLNGTEGPLPWNI